MTPTPDKRAQLPARFFPLLSPDAPCAVCGSDLWRLVAWCEDGSGQDWRCSVCEPQDEWRVVLPGPGTKERTPTWISRDGRVKGGGLKH